MRPDDRPETAARVCPHASEHHLMESCGSCDYAVAKARTYPTGAEWRLPPSWCCPHCGAPRNHVHPDREETAPATDVRPFRWWHRWWPLYSRVYDHCPETPDGQHETREVCGFGAAGFECYQECIHCGRFW